MYIKEEGIFDHPPLNIESTLDTSIDNPGKSTNRKFWFIGLGLVIVSCIAGYYIAKYSLYNSQKKKKSSTMSID